MKPTLKGIFCFALACAVSRLAGAGGPTFDLTFDAPAEVRGSPGSTVEIEAVGRMTPGGLATGQPGAQGWSISMSSVGWAITGVTTAGTIAANTTDNPPGIRNTGFEVSETTTLSRAGSGCEGRSGAVSAVVLSFIMPITLPPDVTVDIVRVTLAGEVGSKNEDCRVCTVEYVDGCRGSGQPVDNRVTWTGNTVVPSLGSASTRVCPITTCTDDALNIAVSAQGSNEQGDPAGLLAGIDGKSSVDVEVPVGETGSATVYAHILSQGLPSGVQGWSLSVAVAGAGSHSATTAGTVAANFNDSPPGLRNTGFEVTENVNPDREPSSGPLAGRGPQGPGTVSAVVLSFIMPITLRPAGDATVLCVTVTAAAPQEEGQTQTVTIEWRDGLQGSGQPVSNVATVAGATARFGCCQQGCINFVTFVPPPFGDYIRCDPNNDGENNLADAVWIVNELFRGGPATACPAAADCNADGMEDLSDALYCVDYQFRSGSPPPPPFPDCGPDPSAEPLPCPPGTTVCP
jgi:hypothetical protein